MAGFSDTSRRSERETETAMKTAISLETAVAMIPDGATLMTKRSSRGAWPGKFRREAS